MAGTHPGITKSPMSHLNDNTLCFLVFKLTACWGPQPRSQQAYRRISGGDLQARKHQKVLQKFLPPGSPHG